jgi:integrase
VDLMTVRAAMSDILLSSGYKLAELFKGKETYIGFCVRHPVTGQRVRIKERVGIKCRTATGREWIRQRIKEINAALVLGWNPLRDGQARKTGKPLPEACTDFLKAKHRENRRPDTLRSYESNVVILLRWVATTPTPSITASAFSQEHARSFMNQAYVERELSPKTFNNIHTFYITLFNWFKEQGYVAANPFEAVKKKELNPEATGYRPPTEYERKVIREDLQKHQPRFFTMCLLCFHAGIRPKEAFMLRPRDFDLTAMAIVIPGVVAKNKRTMGVAIPQVLLPDLLALELDRQHPDHYVFSTRCQPGPRLKNSRYSGKLWDAMRKRTGLSKEVTMYQLKHAGGEQLSRDGIGDVDLMNHFRHHDLAETSTYTRRRYKDGVRTVVDKATAF